MLRDPFVSVACETHLPMFRLHYQNSTLHDHVALGLCGALSPMFCLADSLPAAFVLAGNSQPEGLQLQMAPEANLLHPAVLLETAPPSAFDRQ